MDLAVFSISHQADYFIRDVGCIWYGLKVKSLAHGICAVKELSTECLIHDRNVGRFWITPIIDIASSHNGDSHRLEIIATNQIDERVRFAIVNNDILIPSTTAAA